MPYNASGVFANVAGATSAATGQIIQSTVWNNIHADYSLAFNEVMGQLIAMPTNRNLLWMNGGFEVWQRGISVGVPAASTLYTTDRWYIVTNANQVSTVLTGFGMVAESQLSARVQRNAGETGTGVMRFAYPLDTDEIYRARGNIISLSFRARTGADWSPASGTLSFNVYTGTGASPAKRGATPYTGEVSAISGTVNLTPGAASVAVAVTSAVVVPAGATQIEFQVFWTPVGTAGANDYLEIDDVQIEAHLPTGDYVPTAFDRLPFDVMLEACKRHYQKSFAYGTAPTYGVEGPDTVQHVPQAAEAFRFFTVLPVELRATNGNFLTYNPATATSSAWYNSTSTSTSLAATINGGAKRTIITGVSATAIGDIYMIHYSVSAGI